MHQVEVNTMATYSMKEDELLCDVWKFQATKHNAAIWQSVHIWFNERKHYTAYDIEEIYDHGQRYLLH
uniref:Uncharacterized protein n=1 Tax=Aegilops tauschii subsp. strangulata TaxID=200361 RepID=A0A453CR36_AEGTS